MKYFKLYELIDDVKHTKCFKPEDLPDNISSICIPEDSDNTEYALMMEEVEAGTSSIVEVDDTLQSVMNDLTKYLLTIIGGMGIVILSGLGWVYLRDYDRLEDSIMSVTSNTAVLQEGFVVLNQILANQEDDIKGINIRVERLESPVVTP